MKVMNIQDPQEFLKVIDSCKGQVELITADGKGYDMWLENAKSIKDALSLQKNATQSHKC